MLPTTHRLRRAALALLLAPLLAPLGLAQDAGTAPPAEEPLWSLPLDARVDYEPDDAPRHALQDGGLDVTGDGVPDLLLGSEHAGLVELRSGADLSVVRTHADELGAPGHGHAVALVGDTDGDGLADYAVGQPSVFGGGGRVSLYGGADGGLLWRVDHVVDGLGADERFGAGLARVGDVDGDGVPDLLVGAPGVDTALVLSGVDGGALLTDVDPLGLGISHGAIVRGPGDFDLDGAPDLLVGADDLGSELSGFWRQLRVVSGADGGSLFERQWLKHAGDDLGSFMGTAGDWNLDGHADVVALEADEVFANSAVIHAGPAGDVIDTIDAPADPPLGFLAAPGMEFLDAAAVGDVDGDGVGDLALGVRDQFKGGYVLVNGGSGWIHRMRVLIDPFVVPHAAVSPAGDLDGDGRADTLLGLHAAFNSAAPSRAVVVFGGRPWTVGPRARLVERASVGYADMLRLQATSGSSLRVRARGKDAHVPLLQVVGPGPVDGVVKHAGKKAKADLVLPQTGWYTIWTTNVGAGEGEYKVDLRLRPPRSKLPLSAPSDGEPAAMQFGQKVTGDVEAGQLTSLMFEAPAGVRVDVTLRRAPGSALVPRLALVGPVDGPGAALPPAADLLPNADVSVSDTRVRVKQLALPVTGTWRLDVSGADDSAGGFRLKAKARPPKAKDELADPGPQPGTP